METELQKLKAFISEEEPTIKRGDKKVIGDKEVTIKNVYKRRLEDLTFNDLKMAGYSNPNIFVKEETIKNGKFYINKIVWVVVYIDN